jgi:predicted ferric reductase
MNGFLDWLGIWATTRAAGLTAYLLLFASVMTGIMSSLKMLNGRSKSILLTVHQSSGWFGFLFGLVHGAVLLFDNYVNYSATGLLIPFTAHSHPVLTGLGTLSFYCLLALLLSTDFIHKLGRKTWRLIHFLAFPCFALALTHGLMLGTDSQYIWAKSLYLCTAILFAGMILLRIGVATLGRKRTSQA